MGFWEKVAAENRSLERALAEKDGELLRERLKRQAVEKRLRRYEAALEVMHRKAS